MKHTNPFKQIWGALVPAALLAAGAISPSAGIADGGSIVAGQANAQLPLPSSQKERRALAAQMVRAEFNFPDSDDSAPPKHVDISEATVTLLRLGSDSVPALMAYVNNEVSRIELAYARADNAACYTPSLDYLAAALSIIAVIGDRSCVPALIKELDGAHSPYSREHLAEALIQIGDPRAAQAVFRLATSERDPVLSRQSALHWICRVPEKYLSQQSVTDYLMTTLKDPKAPDWLQSFAKLELLNSRGAEAKSAARAAFISGGIMLDAKPSQHPHALSDEEGIFKAAVEALRQAGHIKQNGLSFAPVVFGGTTRPLTLLAPPSSPGVDIIGHPGPVLFQEPHAGDPEPYRLVHTAFRVLSGYFTRPHMSLAGRLGDPRSSWADYVITRDPFADWSSNERWRGKLTWRDYFPYARSQDGSRVRVGYEEDVPYGSRDVMVYFDVEVRKIDGEWVPVECRQVFAFAHSSSNHMRIATVVPLVR